MRTLEERMQSRPRASAGVLVEHVLPGSPAASAGLRAQDRLLEIDGHPLRDRIDAQYHSAEALFKIRYRRGEEEHGATVKRGYGRELGLVLEDPKIRECANLCPFCFVDQGPTDRALRPGLEIRDDDYRYSFLYGHYVTLTNLTRGDWERIESMKLSPLYVSVHATDPALREILLGRPRVAILPVLERLRDAGIEMHTQVVLCRGVNDGEALARTARELFALHPAVASLAVVPVGLTAYHAKGVAGWTGRAAKSALDFILALGRDYPAGFVQAADEWYSMLDHDPPPADYYGGMAVEENGVGMVRRMLDDWAGVRLPKRVSARSYTIVTGESPARWIRRIVDDLLRVAGMSIDLRIARNTTYGGPITVTGLLGWNDIKPHAEASRADTVIIPDVVVDSRGRFLDDVTLAEAERDIGRPLRAVPATAAGFLSLLMTPPSSKQLTRSC